MKRITADLTVIRNLGNVAAHRSDISNSHREITNGDVNETICLLLNFIIIYLFI